MEHKLYCKNGEWNYTARIVNFDNFTIQYITKGGFQSKDKAQKSYQKDYEKYKSDIKKIKSMTNIRYTFVEFANYWLEELYLPYVQTVTKCFAVYAVKNLIIPNTKTDILLAYVSAEYINDIIKACIPVCDSAGESCKKYLKQILNDAFNYGLIKKDFRSELISVPRKEKKLDLLTHEEIRKLLTEAKKHPAYYFEVLLGIFVGLRSGEIRGLKYTDFNREKQTVRIERQYTGNYCITQRDGHYSYKHYMEEKAPKSGSARLLKIPEFLFDELEKKREFNEAILKNCEERGMTNLPKEYISISILGNRKCRSALSASLDKLCKFAGVPHMRFHALRHLFATLLIESGLPLEEISKLMGHKSVVTTFNVYCGISDAMEQTREYLETICPVKEGEEAVVYVP